jgi:WD40-like Beta Propeller Repeat
MKIFRIGIIASAIFLLLTGAILAAGSGAGDAVWADGSTQTVAPHSSLWTHFQYGGNKKDVTVTLDTADASALRLAIYTPQAVQAWQNGDKLVSVGAGSPVQNHDLGWSGQFNFAGTFYAVVYNDGDGPVDVQVKATGENTMTAVVTPVPQPTALPNPFPDNTPIGKGVSGKIAFLDAQGGNLYTVNGDGAGLTRVSFGMDPQWNHAGTSIAIARQGPVAGIFTIDGNGGNEHLVYGTSEPRAPDWSPDDSRLVFTRQTGVKGGGQVCFGSRCFNIPASALWKLGLLNVSDGTYSDIPTTTKAFTPTWNPLSATEIAYNDTAIGIIKTRTDAAKPEDVALVPFIGDLRPGLGTYDPLQVRSPQYSPDGSKIVMMFGQPPVWQVGIANADGSDRHLLTQQNFLNFTQANNVAPVWSPDSKQIMFLSDRNQIGNGPRKWEIFVMNADGTNVQQVLKNVTDQIPLSYSFESERMLSWSK